MGLEMLYPTYEYTILGFINTERDPAAAADRRRVRGRGRGRVTILFTRTARRGRPCRRDDRREGSTIDRRPRRETRDARISRLRSRRRHRPAGRTKGWQLIRGPSRRLDRRGWRIRLGDGIAVCERSRDRERKSLSTRGFTGCGISTPWSGGGDSRLCVGKEGVENRGAAANCVVDVRRRALTGSILLGEPAHRNRLEWMEWKAEKQNEPVSVDRSNWYLSALFQRTSII